MWAIKHVYDGLSGSSLNNAVELFKTMFPVSKFAEKIHL